MKRTLMLVLLIVLSAAASMPALARTKTPDYYGSQAQAAKQQAKMLKKEAKQRRKAQQRYAKEQRKEQRREQKANRFGI
jgi:uncharacterized protein YxeA